MDGINWVPSCAEYDSLLNQLARGNAPGEEKHAENAYADYQPMNHAQTDTEVHHCIHSVMTSWCYLQRNDVSFNCIFYYIVYSDTTNYPIRNSREDWSMRPCHLL